MNITQTFSIVYKHIEYDFDLLFKKYPEIRKCLPLLIAVKEKEIKVIDNGKN